MIESKPSKQSFAVYKKPSAHYFTLRTPLDFHPRRQSLPVTTAPVPPEMFCNGRCTDATCFDDLCRACIAEWNDYQEARR